MRNELVDLELAGHIVVDQVRQLRATFDAAERAAFPHAAGDELEGWCDVSLPDFSGKRVQNSRLVLISWPAAATPITMLWPHPLWHASNAARMTPTFPVQSNV